MNYIGCGRAGTDKNGYDGNDNAPEAKELHDLLIAFSCLCHEKFFLPFRGFFNSLPWMKKNHIKIINTLYQFKCLTSTQIGKMLDIEKGSLTALIDQLADYGLVNRSADPKDRRKTLITLSPNGKELITKMLDYHTRQISASLANSKSEEIDSFILNLRKAVEFMKKI